MYLSQIIPFTKAWFIAPSLYCLFISSSIMLTSFTTSLILVLPALAAARITHQSRALVNSTACAPVHLILARGTTEGYPGTLKTLAELITDANPGTDYESVIYPATDETSTNSYAEGLLAARNQFTAYAELCEDSKIVFLAYSQVCYLSQKFFI